MNAPTNKEELQELFAQGKISRRQFLRNAIGHGDVPGHGANVVGRLCAHCRACCRDGSRSRELHPPKQPALRLAAN